MSAVALMSPEWAHAYRDLWNDSAEIRHGAKDLTMVIEWRVQDANDQVSQLEITDGEAVYGGAQIQGRKPDFVLTATANVWHRVAEGEIGVAGAIATRKIKFVGPTGASGEIQFHGVVTGEDGRPVPDALVEIWNGPGDDNAATDSGLSRRDGETSTRRNGVITDQHGRYSVRMVPPRVSENGAAPFITVSISARGLPHRLITCAYLPGCHLAKDSLLGQLPAERRQAHIATRDATGLRFDVTLRPANGVTAETSGEPHLQAAT